MLNFQKVKEKLGKIQYIPINYNKGKLKKKKQTKNKQKKQRLSNGAQNNYNRMIFCKESKILKTLKIAYHFQMSERLEAILTSI